VGQHPITHATEPKFWTVNVSQDINYLEDEARNCGTGFGEARCLHTSALQIGIPLGKVKVEAWHLCWYAQLHRYLSLLEKGLLSEAQSLGLVINRLEVEADRYDFLHAILSER